VKRGIKMTNKNIRLVLLSLLVIFIVGCISQLSEISNELDDKEELNENKESETNQPGKIAQKDLVEFSDEILIDKDGTKYIVDPSKIRSGGPSKGGIGYDRGIPALDQGNIKFVSVLEADEWIEDNELVIVLQYKGVKRVYPLQIMVWHEIANDIVAGDNLIITYCPLCGSGIAYKSEIEVDGVKRNSRFGTSGKLYQSNMVMYDEATETYWQQIDGKAIIGELVGQELEEVSIDTVVWRDWKTEHSDSKVLSQDTGMNRAYGTDPYGNYYEDSFLIFPVENEDNRIHPKTIIFGIEIEGNYKAYKEDDLIKLGVIEDSVGGVNFKVTRDDVGIVKIENQNTGEEIVKERDMWFAWYAFHPTTELYEKK
jgi:hypothetical protein